jgi:hypothetical protein
VCQGERVSGKPSPQAVRELGKAWLRILRVREPELLWRLAPDEAQTLRGSDTSTGTAGGSADDVIDDGGE